MSRADLDIIWSVPSQRARLVSCLAMPAAWCLLLTLCFALACGTIPPLHGKIEVGRESFAVFVGGRGPNGDLYAVRADGGPAIPITFTTVAELRPALSPDGSQVAFLRGRSLRDSTPASLWVMNLVNGAERELRLPKGAAAPEQLAWSRDGSALIVRAGSAWYRITAPPGRPALVQLSVDEQAAAESSLAVLVGDPVFARVVPCKRPEDLCVVPRSGKEAILAQAARDPVRWGPDSVAFFVGDILQIRPLSRGRPRLLNWSEVPPTPRQMTFFQAPEQKTARSDQM